MWLWITCKFTVGAVDVNLQDYIFFCIAFIILYWTVLHDHFSLKWEILEFNSKTTRKILIMKNAFANSEQK